MTKYVDLTSGMVRDVTPVTPHNSTNIDGFAVGLYITGAGDISFVNHDGETRIMTVPDNFTLTCLVRRVNATGTTATGIYAYLI